MHIKKIFRLITLLKELNNPSNTMNVTLSAHPVNVATSKYPRQIFDRRAMLKIKIKSLAEESKIIRLEEQRNKYLRVELHEHRVIDVRRESRASQLAYGYIRGRAYTSIEEGACTSPDWSKVASMVTKFGAAYNPGLSAIDNNRNYTKLLTDFDTWRFDADRLIEANVDAYGRAVIAAKAARVDKTSGVQLT